MGADPFGRTGPGLRSAHRHHPAAPAPWQAPGEPQQHPAPGAGPGLACKKAVSLQKSSIAPRGTVCPLWPGQTPGEISFRTAGEKKRRRSDRKSKRPRKKPNMSRRGSLQAATPREPLPFPLLQQREGGNAPERWMGGVLFFKLQRFFCGKAAGFPLPPLNAGVGP